MGVDTPDKVISIHTLYTESDAGVGAVRVYPT